MVKSQEFLSHPFFFRVHLNSYLTLASAIVRFILVIPNKNQDEETHLLVKIWCEKEGKYEEVVEN